MKKLVAALGVLAVAAPAAFASGAFIKVSPKVVSAGQKVRVFGSVDHGCQVGKPGDVATLYSKAFASKHNFAGIPSVNAPVNSKGTFSIKVPTKSSISGTFAVSGRCGGGRIGQTKLTLLVGAY